MTDKPDFLTVRQTWALVIFGSLTAWGVAIWAAMEVFG